MAFLCDEWVVCLYAIIPCDDLQELGDGTYQIGSLQLPTPFELCNLVGVLTSNITLLSWWAVFSCPAFKLSLKHWDSDIRRVYSRSYCRAMNTTHHLSNVMKRINWCVLCTIIYINFWMQAASQADKTASLALSLLSTITWFYWFEYYVKIQRNLS